MSKSTSRVARTCRQAASARPPMTAIGACNGSRLTQTCLRAFSTASAAKRTAPAVKLFEEMKHGPIMLRHLLGVPLAVGDAQVAAGADLAAQPGQQELLTGIQPLCPKLDAPVHGQSLGHEKRVIRAAESSRLPCARFLDGDML